MWYIPIILFVGVYIDRYNKFIANIYSNKTSFAVQNFSNRYQFITDKGYYTAKWTIN